MRRFEDKSHPITEQFYKYYYYVIAFLFLKQYINISEKRNGILRFEAKRERANLWFNKLKLL